MTGIRAPLAALVALCAVAPALAAEIAIGGRALAPGGRPLPEADVLLLRLQNPVAAYRSRTEAARPLEALARAKTGSTGYFDLSAPDSGLYLLRIEAPGHVPMEWRLDPLLEPQELPDAELARDIGLTVRALDEAGKPIAGARAVLARARPSGPFRTRRTGWMQAQQTGATGADGSLRLASSGEGDSVLTVSADGRRVSERSNVRGTSVTLRLEPGAARVLEARSADGGPLAGALVSAGEHEHPLGLTTADGALRVTLPAKDGLRVVVLAADGRRSDGTVAALAKGAKDAPRRFSLPSLVAVTGRLIDAETRKPVEGGWVWQTREVWSAAPTDANGSYTLFVAGGRSVDLAAGATGYMPPDEVTARPEGPESIGPTVALRPAAAIEGTVVDASGEPVAGAALKLSEKRGDNNVIMIRRGGPAAPAATSSSRGRFRVSAVDPSKAYDLEASAKGFAPGTTEILGLEPRKVARNVRLVLDEGLKLTGRTVDVEGRPIRDVEASVRPVPKEQGRAGMIVLGQEAAAPVSAFSDAEGRFVCGGLRPGSYEVSFRRSGFARKALPAVEVKAAPEGTSVGDIALSPGERVQGRVVDPEGRPIEGVTVALAEAERGPMGFSAHEVAGPPKEGDAVTGPDGWFTLADLTGGQAVPVSFARKGYLTTREAGVVPGTTEPLQVTMFPSSKILGVVLDDRGAPLPGADVTLQRSKTGGGGGNVFRFISRESATTDDGGRFVFEGLEPGTISVSAKASGWQEATLEALEVPRGDDLEGVELRLKPGAVITGRVLAPDGRPAVGAEVGIVSDEPEMVRFRGALADGDGRYRLEGVVPGRVSVEATHERYVRVVRDIDAKPGANTLDLALEGGHDVSGVVTDATGAPVAGAWIHLAQRGSDWGFQDATAAPDGSFRIVGVSDGEYRASAGRAGFATSEPGTEITVQGGSVADVRIRLETGITLRGRITGLSPEAMARVDVRAINPSADGMANGSADSDGNYRVEDLAPGTWSVVAAVRPSGEQTRGEVTIEPGATDPRLDLEFGKGLRLKGRVVRGTAPIAGASLFLGGTNVEHSTWSRTETDGSFTVSGLKAGTYRIEVRQWDTGLSYEEQVEVSANREIVIEIPTARVAGIVVDAADGQPVSGATVALAPPDTRSQPSFLAERGVTTDLEGRFRIEDLADGDWSLSAHGRGYATTTSTVTIRSGRGPENLRLSLPPTEGLTLQVQLPSGRAPHEVQAAVLDSGGRPLARGTYATGENGSVRLATVPSGTWEVLVAAGGSGTASVQASAPGAPVPVVLPPACSARIRVPALVAAGVPATATIQDAGGRPFRAMAWFGDPVQEWGLARGEALLDSIPPGAWTVVVKASDGRSWRREFTTAPGAEAAVVLE